MNNPSSPNVFLLIFLPLFAWRIYRRSRRLIGRQRLSKVRPWITVAVYTLLIFLLCLAARVAPWALLWLLGGLGLGALLGVFGLSKTRFKRAPEGMFYTPHAHIGVGLTVLFFARMAWRLYRIYSIDPTAQPTPNDLAHNPLNMGVFGLWAGYYVTYAIGLILWRFGVLEMGRQPEALPVEIPPTDA